MVFSSYLTEAAGRKDDHNSSSGGTGIIKLGAIRDIMDKVRTSVCHIFQIFITVMDYALNITIPS